MSGESRMAWQVKQMRSIAKSLSIAVDEIISLSESLTEEAIVQGDETGPMRDALLDAFQWLESYELLAEYEVGSLRDLERLLGPTDCADFSEINGGKSIDIEKSHQTGSQSLTGCSLITHWEVDDARKQAEAASADLCEASIVLEALLPIAESGETGAEEARGAIHASNDRIRALAELASTETATLWRLCQRLKVAPEVQNNTDQ